MKGLLVRACRIEVAMSIRFSCQLVVIWKRGSKECASQPQPVKDGRCRIEEDLELRVGGLTRHAKSTLSVVICTKAGQKLAGTVNFPLEEGGREVALPLEHCPDKLARLTFTYSTQPLTPSPPSED
jgi:hypothetical protein